MVFLQTNLLNLIKKMPGMKKTYPKGRLIMSVIADEPTVTGFLLTGMGQRDINGKSNYFMSGKETTDDDLEKEFAAQCADSKMGIVFFAQNLAERIRDKIIEHQENEDTILPIIMEIPSKEAEYDPRKDSMLVQAAMRLFGGETRLNAILEDDK